MPGRSAPSTRPTRSLTMSNEYELADSNRADLIYEKADLLAPLLPGMEEPLIGEQPLRELQIPI